MKMLSTISDFFETPTRRLNVLYPTLCIKKNSFAEFVYNYKVTKFQRSNLSRFYVIQKNPQGGGVSIVIGLSKIISAIIWCFW